MNFSVERRRPLNLVIGTLVAMLALSACNGSGDSGVAAAPAASDSSGESEAPTGVGSIVAEPVAPAPTETSAPSPTQTPEASPTPSTAAIGSSCHSDDPNKMCLSLRFVVYQNSQGTPVMSEATALNDLASMNDIWSKCNIAFEIGEFLVVDPAKYGLNYTVSSSGELDKIRSQFQTSDMLLGVTVGPWQISANAWTNMPGNSVYGAVFDGSVANFGPIYAHEFGHYLGLDHSSDSSNVMSPTIYNSSTTLTSSQCSGAEDAVMQYWTKMLR